MTDRPLPRSLAAFLVATLCGLAPVARGADCTVTVGMVLELTGTAAAWP